ncbi:glycoside hydrolase family 3 C-terminal domain-containing protein [Mediterraneibacter glycyrrhizinilyticus]|nr:glycoside hydrolase family 3 N-terminal domain-containing protein [Mediterraneibacter glycyrrhizinilyticus]MBM6854793.1 glycoside hydrolase family 3 C-terminal domain-containing protein [Mediterraneibacter glycyrrhizinilyticus]
MGNVEVAYEDIISALQLVRTHLIVIGVALVCMIAVMILARKLAKPVRGFVRVQSLLAFLVAVVLVVNVMLTGALSNTLSIVLSDMGSLSQESVDNSRQVIEEVTGEGIVMTKNDDSFLPVAPERINVFGWASTNPIYGGTGSGTVDAATAVGILEGLENAGFETNSELSDMYTEYRADRPVIGINDGQDWTLPEVPVSDYSDEMIQNAKDFSDTAMIVISRSGGEGADLPHDMGALMDGTWNQGTKYTNGSYQNNSSEYDDFTDGQTYLELSQTERDLVDMVCSEFENVIVVYNGANTFELGWTEEYDQIKSVLLCAGAGATGFNALGDILAGNVNPSGKTTDTWVRDLTQTPYYNNIGHFAYTNTQETEEAALASWEAADGIVSFVNYTEGIYTGYRFYETAAEEGLIDYGEQVMYPFGYGMSFTTFTQEMGDLNVTEDSVSVDVTVTNTGDTAGKDVVQLYYTPPYENGGIEKSSVNLAAFDKTDMLEPGQSETLTLSFPIEDMASYDMSGDGQYVLEAGTYGISLRSDSHDVIDSQEYELSEDIVYDESNPHSGDQVAAANRFDFAQGDITYLSRADGFANYEEAVSAPSSYELEGEVLGNGTYDPTIYNDPEDEMPTTGADNGLELYDLRGASYDDPRWEDLLDQVTVDEMVELIAYGGHQTAAVDSVGKIRTMDTDGPAGVNSRTLNAFGTGYCSEVLIAQTWNVDLAEKAAEGMCREFSDFGIVGWYAPSMNLHRSAFGGRNFEYYSEDSLLSSRMAYAEVSAAVAQGIYPYIKHFVLNEQEINRNALLCTWFNEQSLRELYMKPFEYCVKNTESGKLAVMSSYNYLGTEWASGCPALLQDVLRGEWGFEGMVISDYFGNYGYMDADRAVRGGTDMMLGVAGNEAIMTDLSATSVLAMRDAVKNIFYVTVNSAAYEDYTPGAIPDWMRTLFVVDGILAAVFLGAEVLVIRSYLRKKKHL